MKLYTVTAQYTITVEMKVKANSAEEAQENAEYSADSSIETEWNGNSVFASPIGYIEEMTLNADGSCFDFSVDEQNAEDCDEEEEE